MQSYSSDDEAYLSASPAQGKFRERVTAFIIGVLALGLAPGVFYIDRWGEVSCFRDSISHYFYAPQAGAAFVMALTFVGAFLFRYRGEKLIDNYVASLGAIAALGIAFFPTAGVGCAEGLTLDVRSAFQVIAPAEQDPTPAQILVELANLGDGRVLSRFSGPLENGIHFGSAGGLFLVLLYFSGYAFTRKNADKDEVDGVFTPVKRIRNGFYWACTAAMVVGGILLVAKQFGVTFGLQQPVFWGELVFLTAFGISWMIKGRFLLWSLDRG